METHVIMVKAIEEVKELNELLDAAWGIIANVDEGGKSRQTRQWREAFNRFRHDYFHRPDFIAKIR